MSLLDGQCLCGQCRLSGDGPALKVVHCQCTDCQKLSGTGHKTNVVVAKGTVILTGPVTTFKSLADSGNENSRSFCANCGTQMLRTNSGMPDVAIIHAGTLNSPVNVTPEAVIWNKSAVAWDYCDPKLPVFAEMPK